MSRRAVLKLAGLAGAGALAPKVSSAAATPAAPREDAPPLPDGGPFAWREFKLRLTRGNVDYAGLAVPSILVNGSTPGPEIRVREGDVFRAVVENALGADTAVHWHGLLVPNHEDGVPGVTQPPQGNNRAVAYGFPIVQAGTYWYHSHEGFQEQVGLAGPFIIEPRVPRQSADREATLFFQDRTSVPPVEILAALEGRADSEPARAMVSPPPGPLNPGPDGKPYEADVFYPIFPVNGTVPPKPFVIRAQPGESVRLRFINGGAATTFRAQLEGHKLEIVAKDGADVVPVAADNFVFAPAERYDAIVTAAAPGAYRLAAAALGQMRGAVAWLLVGGAELPADNGYAAPVWGARLLSYAQLRAPFSTVLPAGPLKRFDLALGGTMGGMNMGPGMRMGGPATTPPAAGAQRMGGMPGMAAPGTPPGPYAWSINGEYYPNAAPLLVRQGERVQFFMANHTRMDHPMHLHGHVFRLLNVSGDTPPDAPLMDTVNVPAMGATAIEFSANNPGAWFFHCHIAYHLETGMARVVRYEA